MNNITQKIKDEYSVKLIKRFFKNVTIEKTNNNENQTLDYYQILLDNKAVKTPMGKPLCLPNIKIANLVKDEWDILEDRFNPAVMHYTKIVNTIIDLNDEKRNIIYEEITEYIGSDLLYYHANENEALILQQEDVWGEILNKIAKHFKVSFKTTSNINYTEQKSSTIRKLSAIINDFDDYRLTLTHALTKLSGSALIPLALILKIIDNKMAYDAIILEDKWQETKWGKDDELSQIMDIKWQDFRAITTILSNL